MNMIMTGGTEGDTARFRALVMRVSAVILVLLAAEFVAILVVNGGHFTFSFDDPYIHLAMAEEILKGHYGINDSESAAAASSILYPFLLAPLLALGFGQFAALASNVVGALAIGVAACGVLVEVRLPVERLPRLTLAIGALVLGSGLVSLTFSGLEHTLQAADALACLWGLVHYLNRRRVSPWWIAALILAPLIRYEGASILAAGILILLLKREWRWVVLAGVIGFGLVGGFSAFLLHLGLSFLPSSVLVKSGELASGMPGDVLGLFNGFVTTLGANIQDPRAIPMLVGIVFCGAPFLKAAHRSSNPASWDDRAFIGLFCALIALAHLTLGAYGWFARYEIYVHLILLLGIVAIYAERFAPHLERVDARAVVWFSASFLLLTIRWVAMVPATVIASQNIYQQQYQMHRFVSDVWKAPVAVNDLGWVSFENENYVLDLLGLGSETARKLRLAHPATGAWMQQLSVDHNVHLAMISRGWFAQVPCQWVPLGALRLASEPVSVPFDQVTFYAMVVSEAKGIQAKIRTYAPQFASGVRFEFSDLDHVSSRKAGCAD